jgi:hypothetical protein
MKKTGNKNVLIGGVILIGLIILAYKLFGGSSGDLASAGGNADVGNRIENILKEMESINFDTDTTQSQVFESFQSIELPLVSLPIGKSNPFSASPN